MIVYLSSEVLQVVNLLVALAIPIIVALVTKRYADSSIKTFALVVLAALLAVLSQIADEGSFVLFDTFMLFIQNILVAVVAHFGLFKPTHVTGKDGLIQRNIESGI